MHAHAEKPRKTPASVSSLRSSQNAVEAGAAFQKMRTDLNAGMGGLRESTAKAYALLNDQRVAKDEAVTSALKHLEEINQLIEFKGAKGVGPQAAEGMKHDALMLATALSMEGEDPASLRIKGPIERNAAQHMENVSAVQEMTKCLEELNGKIAQNASGQNPLDQKSIRIIAEKFNKLAGAAKGQISGLMHAEAFMDWYDQVSKQIAPNASAATKETDAHAGHARNHDHGHGADPKLAQAKTIRIEGPLTDMMGDMLHLIETIKDDLKDQQKQKAEQEMLASKDPIKRAKKRFFGLSWRPKLPQDTIRELNDKNIKLFFIYNTIQPTLNREYVEFMNEELAKINGHMDDIAATLGRGYDSKPIDITRLSVPGALAERLKQNHPDSVPLGLYGRGALTGLDLSLMTADITNAYIRTRSASELAEWLYGKYGRNITVRTEFWWFNWTHNASLNLLDTMFEGLCRVKAAEANMQARNENPAAGSAQGGINPSMVV